MANITTISHLPPQIQQHFNAALLCKIIFEDCGSLKQIFDMIMNLYKKKIRNGYNQANKKIWDNLIEEYLELHDRNKEKEEKLKAERRIEPFRFSYFIENIDPKGEKIYRRIRSKTENKAIRRLEHRTNS